jgi:hypothetical protein
MPVQGFTGCGGCHRSLPTGGWAKGMPLKTSNPLMDAPRTRPEAIRTTGPASRDELARAAGENAVIVVIKKNAKAKYEVVTGFFVISSPCLTTGRSVGTSCFSTLSFAMLRMFPLVLRHPAKYVTLQ